MTYTFDENIVSDLHKDAHGFRPDAAWLLGWKNSTDDQKQSIWDHLCEELEANMAAEKQAEAQALNEFRAEIRDVMDLVSCKWHDALSHLLIGEGYDVGYNTYEQDFDYFLWDRGLGYEDRRKIYKLYIEAVSENQVEMGV